MANTSSRSLTLVMLILAGEGVFLLPFVIPRIFRPALLHAYDFTNLELGTAFSIYGIVAAISYFIGGPLADRFSARKLVAAALVLTGLGGYYWLYEPTLIGLFLLYGYWGFTTIFLLWAAMIKATRMWGGATDQGLAFGVLEGGRGLVAAMVGAIGIGVFVPESDAGTSAMALVFAVVSSIVLLLGILAYFLLPSSEASGVTRDGLNWRKVMGLRKHPVIVWQAVIIFCAYVGYKATDDLSLMAAEVWGWSDTEAAQLGSYALWLRPVFPLLAGIVAFRTQKIARTMILLFVSLILGTAVLGISAELKSVSILFFLAPMLIALFGMYGLRGVYFAGMEESRIPLKLTGTAVGAMSVVGYLPDVFFSPFMGFLLDHYESPRSHALVFGFVAVIGLLGLMASWRLDKINRDHTSAPTTPV